MSVQPDMKIGTFICDCGHTFALEPSNADGHMLWFHRGTDVVGGEAALCRCPSCRGWKPPSRAEVKPEPAVRHTTIHEDGRVAVEGPLVGAEKQVITDKRVRAPNFTPRTEGGFDVAADAARCPQCGSERIRIDWIEVGEPGDPRKNPANDVHPPSRRHQ